MHTTRAVAFGLALLCAPLAVRAQPYTRVTSCSSISDVQASSGGYIDATGAICTSATLSGTVTVGTVTLGPGSAIAGKFGIDQTTPGVTNNVTVTPKAATNAGGTASAIVTGGAATTLITGPVNGCYITNPITATGQAISTAEVAYVNGVTTATAIGNGTNVRLDPGQTFWCTPGQTNNVSAIAATTSHAFSVVKW